MEIIATYLIKYTTTDDLACKGPQYNRAYVVDLEMGYTQIPMDFSYLGLHIATLCDSILKRLTYPQTNRLRMA